MTFGKLLLLMVSLQTAIYTALLTYCLRCKSIEKKAPKSYDRQSRKVRYFMIMFMSFMVMLPLIYPIAILSFTTLSIILSIIASIIILFEAALEERTLIIIVCYILILSIPLLAFVTRGSTYLYPDEGRYIGFAMNIIKEGWWHPFRFDDNDYYQFFHVAGNYLAVQIVILGIDAFTLRKIISLVFTIFLAILVIVLNKELNNIGSDTIPLLFTITSAPLAYLFTAYGNNILGTILALFAIVTLLSVNDNRILPLFTIVSVIGVLAHAVFPTYLIPFLIALTISSEDKSKRKIYMTCLSIVAMITLLYWTFSIILKTILVKGITAYWRELRRFFTQPFKKGLTYVSWYDYIATYNKLLFAVSWTLVPSLALSYLISRSIKQVINKKFPGTSIFHDRITSLTLCTFTVLGVPFLWYLVMKRPTIGLELSHFYGLVFFLVPTACVVLSYIAKRCRVSLVVTLIVIGLATYGVMQDPHYNPTSPALGIASERDWIAGTTIGKLKEYDVVGAGDFRLASPSLYIVAIKGKLKYGMSGQRYERSYLVTIAHDIKGIACIERGLFFQKHPELKELVLVNSYGKKLSIVYNDGFYRSILYRSSSKSDRSAY